MHNDMYHTEHLIVYICFSGSVWGLLVGTLGWSTPKLWNQCLCPLLRFKIFFSEFRLKLGQIPNFSIRYAFDSYPMRFNLVRFLTLILILSTFISFSIQNSIEERKSCSFMKWYNSNMSILLGMATSDWKNNARLPKNRYEQLDWQPNIYITHFYY